MNSFIEQNQNGTEKIKKIDRDCAEQNTAHFALVELATEQRRSVEVRKTDEKRKMGSGRE